VQLVRDVFDKEEERIVDRRGIEPVIVIEHQDCLVGKRGKVIDERCVPWSCLNAAMI